MLQLLCRKAFREEDKNAGYFLKIEKVHKVAS